MQIPVAIKKKSSLKCANKASEMKKKKKKLITLRLYPRVCKHM